MAARAISCAGPAQRGRVIERPDEVEHHRWIAPAAGDKVRGLAPLDDATRALLHRLRRRQPLRDRRRAWGALALALLLHLLFGALTWYEMRPSPSRLAAPAAAVESVLRVRLIDVPSPARVRPPPAMPAPPRLASGPKAAAPRKPRPPSATPADAPPPAKEAPASTTTLHLYDSHGTVRVPPPAAPASAAPASAAPAYVAHLPQGDQGIMQNHAGDKYRGKDTRFAPYFPPPGESGVDTAIRKVIDKTVKTGTVHLPKGVRFHCSTVLFILPAGCGGEPPSPPPSSDGDERLSMPSAPLTKNPHAPRPPSVAKCIAIYRQGKPLPYGCPTDTPTRAVDAQMREIERKRAATRGTH